MPLGAIGDRLGRKPVLLAGPTVRGLAGVGAALARSAEVMPLARLSSGAGAATIMPITLAVITPTLPEEERDRAIGVWTGIAAPAGSCSTCSPGPAPPGPRRTRRSRPGGHCVTPRVPARPAAHRPDGPAGRHVRDARVAHHRSSPAGRPSGVVRISETGRRGVAGPGSP
ncbi:hypothetical protein GCM10010495_68010 [Kitasatospora herbaricolor]|nr:hypothetical protein GCM10010495_68010 [Kitasatospora herbaricolor]